MKSLAPDQWISDVVRLFYKADRELGRQMSGMVVTNEDGCLISILSMFDILLLIGPKHDALLAGDPLARLSGVVSRSGLVAANYADLPAETALREIIDGPLATSRSGIMEDLSTWRLAAMFLRDFCNCSGGDLSPPRT